VDTGGDGDCGGGVNCGSGALPSETPPHPVSNNAAPINTAFVTLAIAIHTRRFRADLMSVTFAAQRECPRAALTLRHLGATLRRRRRKCAIAAPYRSLYVPLSRNWCKIPHSGVAGEALPLLGRWRQIEPGSRV